MELIPLIVDKLDNTHTGSNAFLLLLKEKNAENPRHIPIVIGPSEAQAIVIGLEKKVTPPRPLTHDLFATVIKYFGFRVNKVIINKLHEGIFYALLVLEKEGKTYEFDSRTSDAVAMAVRFDAPIYTVPEVLNEAGVNLQEQQRMRETGHEEIEEQIKDILDELIEGEMEINTGIESEDIEELLRGLSRFIKKTLGISEIRMPERKDLDQLLQKAIEEEDYETAAKIRDLIKKFEEKEKKSGNDEPENKDTE